MSANNYPGILWVTLFILSCNDSTNTSPKKTTQPELKGDTTKSSTVSKVADTLKVSAYLIYNDSTVSAFDVLNDRSIALWNTIIGEGDAGKPSERTKIIIAGPMADHQLTIYRGKRKIEDRDLTGSNSPVEVVLNNTGCDELKVVVAKGGKTAYQGIIPFRCGE